MSDDEFEQRIEILFGRNLTTARLRAGLSQPELATRAGITVDILVQIELGTKDPDLYIVARLAAAVGWTASDLLAR
jgi:transcriptional regulator with XRE-family HTH domain